MRIKAWNKAELTKLYDHHHAFLCMNLRVVVVVEINILYC